MIYLLSNFENFSLENNIQIIIFETLKFFGTHSNDAPVFAAVFSKVDKLLKLSNLIGIKVAGTALAWC